LYESIYKNTKISSFKVQAYQKKEKMNDIILLRKSINTSVYLITIQKLHKNKKKNIENKSLCPRKNKNKHWQQQIYVTVTNFNDLI